MPGFQIVPADMAPATTRGITHVREGGFARASCPDQHTGGEEGVPCADPGSLEFRASHAVRLEH